MWRSRFERDSSRNIEQLKILGLERTSINLNPPQQLELMFDHNITDHNASTLITIYHVI